MIQWTKTAISNINDGGVDEFQFVTHASNLEGAVTIAKQGLVKAHHERQHGNALYKTPFSIIWFSPNDWQYHEGNVFGCVAFDYEWKRLLDLYGDKQYGIQELIGGTPLSRVLLSTFSLQEHFGNEYDPTANDVPWKIHQGQHYHKHGCALQFAVETPYVFLSEFSRIRFIDQKRGVLGERRLHADSAARLFVSRAVGEQIPPIPNMCGIDPATNLPFANLLFACRQLWEQLPLSFPNLNGNIHHGNPAALSFARAVLDRYSRIPAVGPYRDTLIPDASAIAGVFHSTNDLLLSVRQAIAEWAALPDPALLNTDIWHFG